MTQTINTIQQSPQRALNDLLIFVGFCIFSMLTPSSLANLNSSNISADISKLEKSSAPLVQQNNLREESNNDASKPFGYNLFSQTSITGEGQNSNYKIAVGDRIDLKLWGAYTVNETLVVGSDGSIFIPNVGPVRVQGIRAAYLNTHIANKVSTVYSNNVKTYARVATSTPINVFISGGVNRPGQFAGNSQDSIISLLSLAGGITANTGSYRNIQVLRFNRVIANIDLYRFLKHGQLQHIDFQNNDVIHVAEKGTSISTTGATRYPFEFEFPSNAVTGRDLMQYATPLPKTSHVAISGIRQGQPFYKYIDLNTFNSMPLFDQDKISFEADLHIETLGIQVEGSYEGPSFFAVKKGTRLHDVLARIPVNPEFSDLGSIYLKRKSTAAQQKRNLDESLYNLEKSIQTVPSKSDSEAKIRTQEALLIKEFVEKAKQIQPEGRIIISENKQTQNIFLEDGDVIVIPSKTDVVIVSGEVLSPTTLVYNQDRKIKDYIVKAGGYSERADKKKIAILKRNGEVLIGKTANLEPGDSIMVLPKVDSKYIQSTKDITQILYQLALAALAIDRN